MKRIGFILVILGFTLPSISQQDTAPCSFFKTGSFSYRDSVTGHLWEFKRTGKTQLELNKTTRETIKYRIEWLSDCVYKLTQQYSNNKEFRKRNRYSRTYEIISTTERSYTYHCKCSDSTVVGGMVVKLW